MFFCVNNLLMIACTSLITSIYIGSLELELAQGEGSSVLYHPEWNFYDFNLLKMRESLEYREPQGVYKTVKQLYTKIIDENDLFS